MSLTIEQMKFLEAKGLTLSEVIELAEMSVKPARSANAERQARYRQRVNDAKDQSLDDVTDNVTRYVTDGDAAPLSRPPNENNSNPPTHTPGVGNPAPTRTRVRADPFPRPDWADPQHWADFMINRKRKSLPNTASAYKRFCDDIARLTDADWPPGKLLEHAAAHGWAGIYDPRSRDNDRKPQRTGSHHGDDEPRNPYVRAVIARKAERAAGVG